MVGHRGFGNGVFVGIRGDGGLEGDCIDIYLTFELYYSLKHAVPAAKSACFSPPRGRWFPPNLRAQLL